MSTTVDERVVEMRFDNKHFESNVATSMSTLDKFKQKLNLSGATKGLEDIDKASKNVNMSGLGSAVDSVSAKFSAMQVVGITALANITNSAVNAGKSLVKSLSVDQLTSGWKKFSDKTTSVATLVAQGNSIEDVNNQLDRLNWFTDETSYNFTEMVSNIAKFTATGKDLNESVDAMEGIATWAALSGQNAATASRAMYQLSQAMGAGVMRLEDYKSIQNASMDTEEFRQKCLDAGVALGTLQANGDGTYSSLVSGASGASFGISQFATNLTKEMWLTSDVMMKVFNDYSAAVDGIYEAADKKGMLASEIIDEIYATAEKKGISTDEAIKSLGYSFDSFALKAFEAAQKARTFNDAIDSVKDAVSTGWMKTFELIFGDAEKATELWTDLANTLYDVFAAGGEVRNTVLEFALNFTKPWAKINEAINGTGISKVKEITKSVETIGNAVKATTDKLEYFQDVVNKVWRGDYNNIGDTPDRRDLLTEAGYDYRVVQELVNKGYQYELTIEDIDDAHRKFGLTLGDTNDEVKAVSTTMETATTELTKQAEKLTDARLEEMGLTEDEISLYRALEKEADRLGMSVSDLAKEMSENDGRSLLIGSFKNALNGLLGVARAVKEAFRDIFNPPGVGELSVKIYGITKSLNEFSKKLILTEEDAEDGIVKLNDNGEKLKRTFKGIWAVIDVITTVLGGAFKIAFKLVSEVLKSFNLNLLDVTAAIGDVLVAFRDWLLQDNLIVRAIKNLIGKLPEVISKLKEWFELFKNSPVVLRFTNAINSIGDAFAKLRNGEINISELAASLGKGLAKAVKSLPSIARRIGRDFIAGFQNGIGDSISGVIKKIVDFALNFVSNFANALGVHSPSWKGFEIAKYFFEGFINGIKNAAPHVIEFFKNVGLKIVEVFKSFWNFLTDESGNIDWNKIFAGGSLIGLILVLKKFSDTFGKFGEILGSVEGLINSASDTLQSFSKTLNAVSWDLKAEALKKMAISIGILVASIWLLTRIDDPAKLWSAVGVIAILAVLLVGLAFAMDKLSAASITWSKGPKVEGIKNGLLQIGIVILLVAAAVKLIGNMGADQAKQGLTALAGIAAGLLVFTAAMGGISRYSGDMNSIGKSLKQMAIAMLLMAVVCKLAGSLSVKEMKRGALFATAFIIFVKAVVGATKISNDKQIAKVGGMLISMAFAMGLMVGVCKLAALLSVEEMKKGALFAGGFVAFVAALVAVTRISNEEKLAKIGRLILSASVSLLMLVGVCKLVGLLSVGEMVKGALFAGAFIIFMKALISVLKVSNKQKMAEVSKTIIAMSLGIAVLAGVCVLLSFLDTNSLAKGIAAVGMLSLMMSLMVSSLKGAKNAKDAMKWMTISIVAMAAAVVALSFLDNDDLIRSAGSMVALMGAFALMMKSLKGLTKVPAGPIVMMIGVIVALAGVMYLLGELDPKTTLPTVVSLSVLMFAMAGVLKILNGMNSDLKNAFKGALSLTALAIPLLAFSFVLKQMNDLNASIKNVAALIILTAAMAGLVKLLDLMSIDVKKAVKGVVALSLMIAPLLLFTYALKIMNGVKDAVTNVKALVILTSVLTLLLLPLTLIGALIKPALFGVLALTAMAVPLIAFVGVLAVMQYVKNAEENVKTLISLAATLTLLLIPLTLIGALIYPALLGVLALTAMAVPLIAFVGVLAVMQYVKNCAANVLLLSALMTTMSDVLVKIALIAPLAVVGVTALYALAALIVTLGVVAVAIGALVSKFPQLETFIDTGIPILQKLAEGLGLIIGSFVAAFAGAVMTILPQLGQCLSDFMTNASAFIAGAKTVDESVLAGIGILSAAIIALTAAELLTGVTSLLTGGASFAELGTQLSDFMTNALPFIATAMLITPQMLSGVRALADTILILTAADILQGIASFLTGGSSLDSFAEQLPVLGEGLSGFSDSLGSFTDDELATVNCAAQAIKTLAEASSEIPNTGGLLGAIVGNNDLGVFAEQFPVLGKGLKNFLTNIGTFTDEQVATVNCAAEAIKALAEASSEIPNSGGLLGDIVGENDLSTFADQFPILGTGLRGFLDNVGTFTDDQVATVNCAAEAIKSLASAASEIPNSGGWVGAILGENDLGTFADQFPKLGSGLRGFLDNIGTFTDEQIGTVDCAANAVATLASVASKIPNSGGWISKIIGDNDLGTFADQFPKLGTGLSGFVSNIGTFSAAQLNTMNSSIGAIDALSNMASLQNDFENVADSADELPGIAKDLKSFCEKSPDSKTVENAVGNLNKILTAINDIATINSTSLTTFASNLTSIGSEAVKNFVSAFTNKYAKTNVKNAAKDLAKEVFNGLSSQVETMSSAGRDFGAGLINGINAKRDDVYNAAYSLGKLAVRGEKDGQNSNSPSKDTMKAGRWLGEGLIIGIENMGKSVYQAGESMGSTAVNATRTAMTQVLEALNSDIDTQPTIRPVVDLSDVRSGASAISSLLSGSQGIGVRTNLGAINVAMNRKLQNGSASNDDVVSAINKLNSNLEGNRGDTYNFAGITYDSGDEVSNAVQTLVRAAKMGRRV